MAGTRVVTTVETEGSMWSGYIIPVTIIEGDFKGCRGYAELKAFKAK
jgi:hypothetical protein